VSRRWLLAALIAATLATAACPGDGSRIPDDMVGGGIQPTLASLQEQVFGRICTDCHVPGGIGPMPLDDAATTYQNLVGVDSLEIPGIPRVAPGDPDGSYVVWKIEGRPQIFGDRMPPPPQPMLEAEHIEAIVEWIRQGAPQ